MRCKARSPHVATQGKTGDKLPGTPLICTFNENPIDFIQSGTIRRLIFYILKPGGRCEADKLCRRIPHSQCNQEPASDGVDCSNGYQSASGIYLGRWIFYALHSNRLWHRCQ